MHPQQVGIVVGGDDDLATESAMKMIMIMIMIMIRSPYFCISDVCLNKCVWFTGYHVMDDCFSLAGQEMRALEGN